MALRRAVVAAVLLSVSCRGQSPAKIESSSRVPALRPSSDGGFVRPGAEPGLRDRVAVDPKAPESLYLAGQQEFLEGRFAEAADHLRQSIRLAPSAKAWHALGDALLSQVRFGEAADAFREAVQIDPAKRLSWMRLGRCLINSGRPNEAVEAYRKAEGLMPGELTAPREQVEALLDAKRYDDAAALLERTAAADPAGSAKDLVLIGQIRSRQQRWPDAVAALRRAVAVRPDADAFNQIGEALVRMGDLPGARDAFREAAQLGPTDPFAWEAVGEIEVKLGRPEAAKAAFESSLKVKDRPGPHLGLGRVALAAGSAAAARAELDKALETATGETPAESREIASFALQAGAAAVAVKLLEMLAAEPEGQKDAALLRELATAYSARRSTARGRDVADLARKIISTCERARAVSPPTDRSRCPETGG